MEHLQRLQYTGPEADPEPQPVINAEAIGDTGSNRIPKTGTTACQHRYPGLQQMGLYGRLSAQPAGVQGKYSFEVIVVDDQSSDETAEQLAKIEGLTT